MTWYHTIWCVWGRSSCFEAEGQFFSRTWAQARTLGTPRTYVPPSGEWDKLTLGLISSNLKCWRCVMTCHRLVTVDEDDRGVLKHRTIFSTELRSENNCRDVWDSHTTRRCMRKPDPRVDIFNPRCSKHAMTWHRIMFLHEEYRVVLKPRVSFSHRVEPRHQPQGHLGLMYYPQVSEKNWPSGWYPETKRTLF